MFAYVGQIARDPSGGAAAEAITVLELDEEQLGFRPVQTLTGLASPTYLALHPSLPVLYAGERDFPPMGAGSPGTGAVTALRVGSDGKLEVAGKVLCPGPAHVSVHPNARWLFAAMNRAGLVGVFPLGSDGAVGAPVCTVQHEGRGPKSPNQDRAFPHSTWLDHDRKRLLVCDLALDRVLVYDFDDAAGQLTPAERPFAQVSSGAGPRHLAFHPTGHFVYVLNELDSTISGFAYEANSARLTVVQTVSAVPEDFEGQSAAAQIQVHPSGRWLYASNRGHDSIAVFAIDQATGKLRLLGHEPSLGERPHNFTLDRDGRLMVVANQRSGQVASFHVDQETGALRPAHAFAVSAPVCVVVR